MYERNQKSWTKHLDFMLLDAICLEVSFLLAYIFRFDLVNLKVMLTQDFFDVQYKKIMLWILIFHVMIILLSNPYSGILKRSFQSECKRVFLHNLYMLLGLVMIMFMEQSSVLYSRIVIFLFPSFSVFIMLGYREAYKYILRRHINNSDKQDCVLLVAPRSEIDNILRQFYSERISTLKIVGIVLVNDDSITGEEGIGAAMRQAAAVSEASAPGAVRGEVIWGIPVVGDENSLYEYARTNIVDEVLLYTHADDFENITKTFISMGITVHICLDSLIETHKTTLNQVNGIPVVTAYANLVSYKQMVVKRLIDICFGLVGSVAAIILTIFVAPMIWIADPGPVFFRQERVGRNGRTFKIWKFRTMCVNADAMKAELMDQNEIQTEGMFKMENDPRIIGINKKFSVGAFLRDTSIDEFPQFFNILGGSMSLVGTRPPTVDEYETYKLHHKGRLAIKPGLTGMWQVSGRSKITDFEKVVKLDKYYIEHFSLGLDFKIILRTIKVVLKREGAK